MIISKRSIEQNNVDNFTTKALNLSVNVFCTKVLYMEVIILTSSNADGTVILRGHPNHAKVSVPLAGQRQYRHFSVISRP